MIITTLKVMMPPENLQELRQTIESLMNSISRQKGFVDLHLYLEAGLKVSKEAEVCLMEEWETPTDFYRHARSHDFTILLGAFNLLKCQCEIKLRVLSPVETKSIAEVFGRRGREGKLQVETQAMVRK